ncbi:MAG: tetratricopeptide repeat protein [Microcoleus sp. PH2017_40_RAT_O_B]|nr:tetratricopeptide repeat protein [Microcoleus sp. PH2017_09_SFU_O_A]MCC3492454.1 tetratricopeptide repeat protein [Microcoleus sp. PH2017_16_JOR_D_A]MCC3573659.1 tetratricopeptide repeat protein [Microcoleus sp. PH2017_34_RAT_O_A]MCC3611486.1 tetratricopeptide repeat protein [Microcoleus sp. PH2017_40_RAT_O_B]MCC3631324.1 tetratricopeptide repeat protein [Microcoleus sp. PH2017_39_LGB_O_B]MCC3643541.1 tetratricopeptide repeat protein [Microcoleus sp. PH2017_33_LGB_O_A]TAF87199.1 MAG: CHAT 
MSWLGIAGLWFFVPELAKGQVISGSVIAQSDELAEAERLNEQAVQLYKQGKYDEAIPLAEQALAIRRKVLGQDHPSVATSLNNLAALYESQGRYREVEPLYRKALEMRQRLLGNEHPDVAASLNNLAALYALQGRYSEAEAFYRKALEMNKRLLGSEHPNMAASLNNLALLYDSQGRYSEAEPLFRQTLEMRQRLLGKEHPSVAISLNNLALSYTQQGRYSEAEPLFRQTLEMRQRLLGKEHPSVATSSNNLAFLYASQGRYSEAEPLYRKVLEMRQRLLGNEHPDIAASLNNLAGLYYSQRRYSEAEPLFRQALEMNKRLLGNEHPSVANSLNNLALWYASQGRYSEAEPIYRKALKMRQRLLGNEHPDIATSLNNLALLCDSQERYSEAEPLFRQALEMRQRLLGKEHPDVAISLNNLAALYWRQGNTDRTLEFQAQGIKVEEQNLSYNLAAGFDRQKRDYIKTVSGTTNANISLHLNAVPNNSQAARLALTTIFQRKGRILDIFTNSLQILRQRVNDPESQKLIDNLSNTYSQLATLIYNQPEKLPLQEYRQRVSDIDDRAKQLEDQLSRRSAEFRTLAQSVPLEKIQKLIPTDAALVEFVRYQPVNPKAQLNQRFGEPHYAAYILTSSGNIQAIDLGEANKIEKSLELFRQSLADQNTPISQLQESARNLDRLLMQPVRKLLGNTDKILLSPDGALNLIPFEALVDENNQYLVENYSFTYLTSGRDLLRLQISSPSQQPPVVIADPYFDRPGEVATISSNNNNTRSIDLSKIIFSPLSGTAEEARAIASLFKINPLLHSQATESAIKQVKSPQILHIATHGFFQDGSRSQSNQNTINDNPLLLSGLVLSGFKKQQGGGNEDGVLTALEVTTLNLVGTKLVALSACDTGIGKDATGEGIYGLRRALVIAGSESQLISLWKVDDNGTKDLMVKYYNRLLNNQGRSEALRQTQLEMLKSETYQHPYYWAAFIPSGDWRPMGLKPISQ